MIKIQEASILDVMPSSIKNDPQVQAASKALDEELRLVTEEIKSLALLPNLENSSDALLDVLAWTWHVDYYRQTFSREQKIKMIRSSVALHRKKGTPAAVENALSTIFPDIQESAWHEYGGTDPYYFRLTTESKLESEEQLQEMLDILENVKRGSAWLEGLYLKREIDLPIYMGAATSTFKTIDIYPTFFQSAEIGVEKYQGIAINQFKEVDIYA